MLMMLGLFIFVLPLALASSNSSEPATLLASSYSALLLVFSAFWTGIRGLSLEKLRPLRRPLVFAILLLIAASAFSIKHSQAPEEIFRYTLGLILFLIVAPLPESEKKRLVPWIILGAFAVSVLALRQYFFGFDLLRDYVAQEKTTDPFILEKIAQRRVFFPFPTPGILGGYLAMTLPLAFHPKKRMLFLIPLTGALLLTKSLGALISLTAVTAVLFLPQAHSPKKKIFAILALGAILGCVFALRTDNASRHLLPVFSLLTRVDYWKETWEIIRAHPLTGAGLGNFDLSGSRYAHNSFLQLWAEAGLAGIVSFLWLVIAVLKKSWKEIRCSPERKQKIGLLAGVCVFLVHNLMDFTFFLPATSFIWWVMLGLLYSPAPQTDRS